MYNWLLLSLRREFAHHSTTLEECCEVTVKPLTQICRGSAISPLGRHRNAYVYAQKNTCTSSDMGRNIHFTINHCNQKLGIAETYPNNRENKQIAAYLCEGVLYVIKWVDYCYKNINGFQKYDLSKKINHRLMCTVLFHWTEIQKNSKQSGGIEMGRRLDASGFLTS